MRFPHLFQGSHQARQRRRVRLMRTAAFLAFTSLLPAFFKLSWAGEPRVNAVTPTRGAIRLMDGTLVAVHTAQGRQYPLGPMAANVVGFLGADGGLEGLERTLNAELAQGKSQTLTLNGTIQAAAEQVLEEAVKRVEAASGSVVVMDRHTGHLLAVANWPTFDPGAWAGTVPAQWRNRAFVDEYEPGSVIKALTVAALLEENLTSPAQVYETPMRRPYAGTVINDLVPHPSVLRTWEILRYSSNVGMTRLIENVPPMTLHRAFQAFGLGLAVELPGPTANGSLAAPDRWTPLTQATMSFGQGLSVTNLQMAAAFNVIANDGVYIAPRLSPDQPRRTRRVLRPDVARTMQRLLHAVIDEGIQSRAELPGYHVGGKTGTAQVAIGGRYSSEVFTSTFAGFFPAEQPRYTVTVMVRGAKREYQGSQLAAPIFREITAYILSMNGALPALIPPPTTHEADEVGAQSDRAAERSARASREAAGPEAGPVHGP
ncbi:penicillin-binding protein 2 [Deinococcus sp. 6GRE01]|uniref:peptidoglycan D,D-transpeptidase FtsI family protein n=1 Tax=unclassified Deinococcus TaxID=2623546 RepID=UPI001E51AF65|nr:penicillin-binding protein 2 [Deinococcus sp. 6GRE01]MCD0156180.1 penicillin-binding protein 2 [Deinococcus sp. 6GRE01]